MQTVGLVAHLNRSDISRLGENIIDYLDERGIRTVLLPESAARLGRAELARPAERVVEEAEVFLALGGDGTLLDAIHLVAGHDLPVLGINMGRLGFLTEVEAPDAFWALDRLLAGEYILEERFMLQARVLEKDRVRDNVLALNDIVISRGTTSSMITLRPVIGSERVGTYRADGLIVATATGSTAYSLSAGGPVVHPGLDVLILTPICPHSLQQARSVVVSPEEIIRVEIEDGGSDVYLIPDGRQPTRLRSGDVVQVTKSAKKARFIKVRGRSFYEILRSRISDDRPEPGALKEGSS